MRLDVEDASGTRQGAGPIRTAKRWRVIRRLTKAGEISFDVSRADPALALLRDNANPHPVVRCWTVVGGALTERGAGIANKLTLSAGGKRATIAATGPDILDELTYRSVAGLRLTEDQWQRPFAVRELVCDPGPPEHYDDMDRPEACDGNPATHAHIHLNDHGTALTPYFYVASPVSLTGLDLALGTFNAQAETMKGQYYRAAGWNDLDGYVDNTEVGGCTLAQSDTMEWNRSADEVPVTHSGMTWYWYRFHASGDLDDVEVDEIRAYGYGPLVDDLAEVIALAPTGWSLDAVNGYGSTANGTYAEFSYETVLNALIKIAEKKHEHFVLSPGERKVRWLRGVPEFEFEVSSETGDFTLGEQITGGTSSAQGTCQYWDSGNHKVRVALTTAEQFEVGEVITGEWSAVTADIDAIDNRSDCGIRAVAARGYSDALVDNADVCLIESISEEADSSDARITRIYPFGAGNGDARVTLEYCTRTAPSGFTLDTANNYIAVDTELAANRIDRVRVWSDIGSVESPVGDEPAANALFDAALAYLKRHIRPYMSYRLTVSKLDTIVLPGQTIRVVYSGWVNGIQWADIDQDLIILETTEEITNSHARMVAMQVSTLDRWPESDAEALAQLLENGQVYQTHKQAGQHALMASGVRAED